MLITTIESIPGKIILEHYGIVNGSTVRSINVLKDLGQSVKNFFGGELKNYTKLLSDSRDEAIQRMIKQAANLGANAIINVRFATSEITTGAAEIYVYGTAVLVTD